MRFSIIALGCLLAMAIANPAINFKVHVIHERRGRIPMYWERDSELHGDSYLPMRIALSQSSLDRADEFLMDVSNPNSPNYGKHWPAKQVAETFAPSTAAVDSVLEWLATSGVLGDRVRQSQGLNLFRADITVSEAEELLKTNYYAYTHAVTGQAHIACENYSMPEDIQRHIDFVTPTIHFDTKVEIPKRRRTVEDRNVQPRIGHSVGDKAPVKYGSKVPFGTILSALEHCNVSIVLNCLRALYEIPPYFPANPKNSYGIVEYTPQAYLASDLDMFFRNFSPFQVGQRPTLDSIDEGFLQTEEQYFDDNGEADLVLQYFMSLMYLQQATLYQAGDILEGASFNNFLDALDASYCTYDGGDNPNQDSVYPDTFYNETGVYKGPETCGGFAATDVISTSSSYDEHDLTPFYEMRQCYEYMKLGLQGVTFLFSSGDNGVGGIGGFCIDPVSGRYIPGTSGILTPSFPSTCPYVTSVGATEIKSGSSVTQSEAAAEFTFGFSSGGGFSNVFSAPSYQTSALATYFKNYLPPYGADR